MNTLMMKAKEHQFLNKEGSPEKILTNYSSPIMSLLSEQIKRNNRTRSSLVLKKRLNPQKLRTNKSRKLRLQKIHISIRKMTRVTKIAFKLIKHSTQLKTSYQLPSQRHNSVTKFIEYPRDLGSKNMQRIHIRDYGNAFTIFPDAYVKNILI